MSHVCKCCPHSHAQAAEIERLKADLATFGKDTVATENRIIDAEFSATELRRRVELATQALFPPPEKRADNSSVDHSVDGNLESVIIDLRDRGADALCLSTLNTIMIRLIAAREALTA